jgi:hypothetical protein
MSRWEGSETLRRLLTVTAVVGVLLALGLSVTSAAGPPSPSFYVDGELYRTVGTPTDLPVNEVNAHSFDVIYQFFGVQPNNVAGAAPGDPGFNGGRWMVHGLTFDDYAAALAAYDANGSGDFDSDEEVEAALAGGLGGATDIGIVRVFECPVLEVPGRP